MPHVNLASPGALDAVFQARAHKGEVIVSCFKEDEYSLRWMHHFALMAQAVGYDHFVPIGWDAASCEAFRRSWCGGVGCTDPGAHYPGCAFLDSSAVDGGGGHPRWVDAKKADKIVYLWMVRYHVATEALRRGINVLMSDTDVSIQAGAAAGKDSSPAC